MPFTTKHKQIIVLICFVALVFVYSFYWKKEDESLGRNNNKEDEIIKDNANIVFEYDDSDHPFYNDPHIRLAREYQIDLSKQLWSSNRFFS